MWVYHAKTSAEVSRTMVLGEGIIEVIVKLRTVFALVLEFNIIVLLDGVDYFSRMYVCLANNWTTILACVFFTLRIAPNHRLKVKHN